MVKIDDTVLKETRYIAIGVVFLSIIIQAVFLILRKWNYTVLLGNLLSSFAVVFNFLLMGITVQKAVKKEEKDAKNLMKLSHLYRTLFLLIIIVIGVTVPVFNMWAVIIPVFFPRIIIAFRPLFSRR